ncbi:MAG: 2-amino-4-hydroxy-6-hydroxymethyldihydropteridine diphosphokinase [Candidatus Omnitrophica bacterium]|nr:2-amino-4-hydroxy-6-hydroxymethyldihydropteridine diphosphokinase [Candidatus Omnitrophota bacterium]
MMATVYLALGSNLGDRRRYLQRAIEELKSNGVVVRKVSTIIETFPVGGPPQDKYLNAVLKAYTFLSPEELYVTTRSIEHKLGRVREIKNGPRVIDIDILLYGDLKLVSRRLVIPHPYMIEREFVMKPLEEIDPNIVVSLRTK